MLSKNLAARRPLALRCQTASVTVCCSIILILFTSPLPASSKNLFQFFPFHHQMKETRSDEEIKESVDKGKTLDYVSCKILISAPVDVVWQTVHVERDSAPDLVYNKLLSSVDNHSKFEQKWTVIPFIAKSTCVIDEVDFPTSRIDYRLLESDQFKVMEGSWLFTPTGDGTATMLELNAHLQLRRPGPKPFLNAIARKKMNRRLEHVKELAEATRTEMKVKATVL